MDLSADCSNHYKIMDSEVSELEEYDNEKKNVEFVTSTPEKRKFEC